jgi:hypothetical protein
VHTTERISKFYEDVTGLHLEFPVAEISQTLKKSKGYVSGILNKKKKPGKKFLDEFYKKFSISSQNKSMENYTLPIGDLKITLKDHFELLISQARKAEEREKEYLEIIKSKLISIDTNSKEIAEDISALTTEIQAEHRAMMDSIDVAAKQPIGTTAAAADTVELASQDEHLNKGKKVDVGKKTGVGKRG